MAPTKAHDVFAAMSGDRWEDELWFDDRKIVSWSATFHGARYQIDESSYKLLDTADRRFLHGKIKKRAAAKLKRLISHRNKRRAKQEQG